MNREIKFRAFIKTLPADYRENHRKALIGKIFTVVTIDFEDKEICVNLLEHMEDLNDEKNLIWVGFGFIELMQFTGLKDKNVKDIYDEDILKITNEFGHKGVHIVKYGIDNEYPAFEIYPSLNEDCNSLQFAKIELEIEKIGNKYENPELLENKND